MMEPARWILELMFLTAWSDGTFGSSEALAIHKLVAQVPLLRELRQTGGIDRAAKRRLDERGLEACVREAAAAITDGATVRDAGSGAVLGRDAARRDAQVLQRIADRVARAATTI